MIDFNLYLITDRHQVASGHTLPQVIQAALDAGVKAIQLREKDLPTDQLHRLAAELRALTCRYGARLLINDRIDIGQAVEADGVHLGGQSLPVETARQLLGPDKLIGVSTHSLDQIDRAARGGADFVTFGPVYATPSKAAYGPPLGIGALTRACRHSAVPVFALGGVNPARRPEVLACGAAGIALISAIIASQEPSAAARCFLT